MLLYLFRRIERALHGQPAAIIIDEAWLMLGHPAFRAKIREWLKVMRKANCLVLMATQSLSDAANSGILDVIVESTATKIFLPNIYARDEDTAALYRRMGLNARQIEILATAIPQRQYYYVSENGRRLYDLALGPLTLAFVGASDKESIAAIKAAGNEIRRSLGRGVAYEPGSDITRVWSSRMSFTDTLKAVAFNKHATKAAERAVEPLASEPKSTSENPYLAARRTWNEHVGAVVSSRQTWQVVGILSLLIALASVGGIVYIGSQSKFVPYVVRGRQAGAGRGDRPGTDGRAGRQASDRSVGRLVHRRCAPGDTRRGLAAKGDLPRLLDAGPQ